MCIQSIRLLIEDGMKKWDYKSVKICFSYRFLRALEESWSDTTLAYALSMWCLLLHVLNIY